MKIICIREFYDSYRQIARKEQMAKMFNEFCVRAFEIHAYINFCLYSNADDPLEFLKQIATRDRSIGICQYDPNNLRVVNGEAVYVPQPSIDNGAMVRCIALLSDDEALSFMQKNL